MAEKILIISPIPLFPGHAGNRERIRATCTELMEMGYQLDFFYTGFEEQINEDHSSFFNGEILQHALTRNKVSWVQNPVYRFRELFQGLHIKMSRLLRTIAEGADAARYNRVPDEYRNFGKWLLLGRQVQENDYKTVIVNYAPYSFYFDLFEDQTVKIIDTHDRLTDRYKLFLERNTTPVNWYSLRKKDEQNLLARADVVWAITEEEKSYFKEILSQEKVKIYTLRHLIRYRQIENETHKNRLLMIGSSNQLNIMGLTWFLEQVWKKVRHYHLDVSFMVAGSICDAVDTSTMDEQVELYGKFDSPEEIYKKGDFFINPMRDGTGLKIKTLEALASGKFVLSTEAGASGLNEFIGNGLICSDDPATWIQEIKSFFMDPSEYENQRFETGKMVDKMYSQNLAVLKKSVTLQTDSGNGS